MMRPRIAPNERGRLHVTLPGAVIAHEVKDLRWNVTKWLDRHLPNVISQSLGFRDALHYMVQVHLDDEPYALANGKLDVEYLNGSSVRIDNNKLYEVQKVQLTGEYAVGKRVSVTYGMSPMVDQYFTGTIPIRWELKPLESKQKFLELPGALLPRQHDLFFA